MKRFEESLASYDQAIALSPKSAEAYLNRGTALAELKRFEEAVASYQRAGDLLPEYGDAHFNVALCKLRLGEFDIGWQTYEWRWQSDQLRHTKRSFTQPQWAGEEEIAGRTILLHAEQGFGDAIQFCRYIPLVVERGARVILEVQEPLRELMTSLVGTTQVISVGSALPDFDLHCPLLSLPLAFGTRVETIPSVVPYLRASSQGVADWGARLGSKRRPKVGLAWSGRPAHVNDRNRSIRLAALLSLLDIHATFVSLQKHVQPEDARTLETRNDLLHFGDALTDFSTTAALIANLDLVIAVDTGIVHLAGALAKSVWVLLPFLPDWRWLLDRDDSPWYPTARLFRQEETRTWDNVIARVYVALSDFVQRYSDFSA
jgi:tetratricopeptide (TPR) repeat protein